MENAEQQDDGPEIEVATNTARLIEDYILARDLVKDIDTKWAAKKKIVTDFMEKISGQLQEFMETNGNLERLCTRHGTCYRSIRYSASVRDGEAFMKFVQDGHFDMIERRANATVVQDYVRKNNQLPPGVSLTGVQTLGVRRPGKSKPRNVASPTAE